MTSFLARGFSLILMIVSVTATISYLGPERFGVWMTISSFAVMLTFLDLGMGNALTNRVAQAASENNSTKVSTTISGGLGAMFILALVMAGLLVLATQLLPWQMIMNVESSLILEELNLALIVFALLFSASTFTNGISRVLSGLQKGFEVHLAGIIGSLMSLAAILYASGAQAGIPVLLACSMLGPILANLTLLTRLGMAGHFSFARARKVTSAEAPKLVNQGALFLMLQIGVMAGWGTDSLIIANTAGFASVAAFAICQRMTQVISQPLLLLNAPLWPAYADAYFRGEKAFIRKTFKQNFIFTIVASSIGATFLIFAGGSIAQYWTQNQIQPDHKLIVAAVLWMILSDAGSALGTLLNGIGIVKQQVWVVSCFVALALPLKYFLGLSYGATGVLTAGILAYCITTVAGYGIVFRSDIRRRLL
ncbi:MAG: hypothetical protein WCK08_06500 [Betaproteobacteria bacterium]